MNMQGQPVRVRRRASRGARERRASGDDGVELTFEPDERRRRRSRRRDARRRETDEDDDDDDATRRSSRRAQLDIPEDGVVNAEEQELARERQRENEERRGAALASVLEPAARERLSRIAIVKPEKARALEESILRAAQAGRVHKVSEQALIGMLENAASGGGSGGGGGGRVGKINFDRRRNAFDEDDEM